MLPNLQETIANKAEVDRVKQRLEAAQARNEPSAKFIAGELKDAKRKMASSMRPLIDILPEYAQPLPPVVPGNKVTLPYMGVERKAEILVVSRIHIHYDIESRGLRHDMPTLTFTSLWGTKIRPYHEKGARMTYLGDTPSKTDSTGKKVIAAHQTRDEGSVVLALIKPPLPSAGKWHPLTDCDMSHSPVDAVDYWNSVRKSTSPRSDRVRDWMLDPKNYKLEPAAENRSRGAREKKRYLPP